MDSLEEFESYMASKTPNGHLLNVKLALRSNEVYDTAVRMLEQYDTRRNVSFVAHNIHNDAQRVTGNFAMMQW